MFDQESNDGTPKKYYSDGVVEGVCVDDLDYTDGQMLYSQSQMSNQISCKPNAGNTGNWYSWATATTGGHKVSGDELNSVCPKGWRLLTNTIYDQKSWYYLIRNAYSILSGGDNNIKLLPLSFIRTGNYTEDANFGAKGITGFYWSSATADSNEAYSLMFSSTGIDPQNYKFDHYCNKLQGFSLRCLTSHSTCAIIEV